MGSIVAYFHKHFNSYENKMRPTRQMKREIKRMQKQARQQNFFPCDKCGELFKKEDLIHVDEINEDFCQACINLMKLARDDY